MRQSREEEEHAPTAPPLAPAQWGHGGLAVSSSESAELALVVQGWRLAAAGAGERGPVRRENQDVFRLERLRDGGLGLLLADGMGGQAGGGDAAAAAVAAAAASLADSEGGEAALRGAIDAANAAVAGVRHRLGGSPGTTLDAAIVSAGRLALAHVGDSRAYLVREGAARLITEDHSVTGERVRAGLLSPEEARTDPRRNYLTRALLGDPVEPHLRMVGLRAGDRLVLCSDGVWSVLADSRIAEVTYGDDLLATARELVGAALSAGSTDNATAVVARVEREGGA